MSENEQIQFSVLLTNIRVIALELNRANDLKEIELILKYPEHQELIQNESYEEKIKEMVKDTKPYTKYHVRENKKQTENDK